ncbi:hypothetical protein [Piscirickettsia salmonis]|nr:hypothetical protein [Piscirickettsia salmonis]ERL60832.1 hypothetical protein K661_02847 [Piscirickettsia salmonis LF-89 = ATCC VR-1361]
MGRRKQFKKNQPFKWKHYSRKRRYLGRYFAHPMRHCCEKL